MNRLIETNLKIQKMVEPLIKLSTEIEEMLAVKTPVANSLSEVFSEVSRVDDFLRNIQWTEDWPNIEFPNLTPIVDALKPTMEEMGRHFEALSPRVQQALLLIAEHGWYFNVFDYTFPLVFGIAENLEMGNVTEVDEFMMDYYEKGLGEIEEYLVSKYPHRAHLLKPAFCAHRNGDYELSTLAFLTQVDGICWDCTDCNFFLKKGGKPQTAEYVEEELVRRSLTRAMLSILTHLLPISYSSWEREQWEEEHGRTFAFLNRHEVLHGESLDYGTEKNSLKAVSLLYYVARALEHGEQMKGM